MCVYVALHNHGHVTRLFILYSVHRTLYPRFSAHACTHAGTHTHRAYKRFVNILPFFPYLVYMNNSVLARVTDTHTHTTHAHTFSLSNVDNRNSLLRGFDLSLARANFHSTSLRKSLEIRNQGVFDYIVYYGKRKRGRERRGDVGTRIPAAIFLPITLVILAST